MAIKTVSVKIEELRPSEYNPRKWSEKAIRDLTESVREFGMVDPIIANSAEGMKRKARVIEIESLYAEIILQRWSKFTGKEPIKNYD